MCYLIMWRSVSAVALAIQGHVFANAIQLATPPPENAVNESAVYTKLWDGQDLNPYEYNGIHVPIFGWHSNRGNHSGLKFQIAGPFDSGTNLMEAMIAMNFPSAFKWTNGERKLWKHSVSGSGAFTNQFRSIGYNSSNFVVIAMVREPLSLLGSWKKAPYDLKHCVKDWDDVLKPCKGFMRAWTCFCTPSAETNTISDYFGKFEDEVRQRMKGSITFNNIADVFEKYFQQYHMLAKENQFAKVEIVHYEDLVTHPDLVMKRIGKALGMPIPDKIGIVADPAKTHGQAVGYDAAVQKLRERPWLKEIPGPIQKSFCSSLSGDTKAEYSLEDCA